MGVYRREEMYVHRQVCSDMNTNVYRRVAKHAHSHIYMHVRKFWYRPVHVQRNMCMDIYAGICTHTVHQPVILSDRDCILAVHWLCNKYKLSAH